MGQMNVRIDEALKERGDRTFRAYGLTPSVVVRAVWSHVAETGEIPAFIFGERESDRERAREYRRERAEEGAGLAAKLMGLSYPIKGDLSYEELRELAYGEQLVRLDEEPQ
jgi:addiction module RelB/DinJ family antitoxin